AGRLVRGQLRGLRGEPSRAPRRRGRPPPPDHVQEARPLVSGAPVLIRHFTAPGCPFAFSAERQRLRLLWLYGAQIEWELHMVVLAEERPGDDFSPAEGAERPRAAHALYGRA